MPAPKKAVSPPIATAIPSACTPPGVSDPRALASFGIRFETATAEAQVAIPAHPTNGDETKYSNKIGTYSKCLKQDNPCLVNPAAFADFRHAINSGKPSDWAALTPDLGGARPFNGPQAMYAYTLEGTDGWQFGTPVVPPAPALASKAYAAELVDLYWCSLLRDVAFTDYPSDPTAAAAAAELASLPDYTGPKDPVTNTVTPRVLFRGGFPGETTGPYLSQLLVQPTAFGAQPISQQLKTFLPGVDYMTDLVTFGAVQNGIDTGLKNQMDPVNRYLHDGRGLAAYTHVDVLYQAYFTAFLVLESMGIPKNPGNPYIGSKTQQAFGTFGGPDIASVLADVAKIALNACWYQKWFVHLRHRPESGGGIVHLVKNAKGSTLDPLHPKVVHPSVLNSQALQASFNKYGSYLLSQAFPEGSPAHPAYPTGHGAVGGACITVLKFFYNGAAVFPTPVVPSSDGLALKPYTYTSGDLGLMTVDGELNKLAHNISFGHGLHAGIHWRSDTDVSMQLGEAIAISVLNDLAETYNEKFSVTFNNLAGNAVTISN